MPKQKDLKRLTRARMKKTGESYTSARVHLIAKKRRDDDLEPQRLAEIAGMSNEAVTKRTGADWAEWVRRLDAADAMKMPHREIARHVADNYEVSDWWAQMVTVSYERVRGLRDVGQRRSTGTYDANKSKTFPVPIAELYRAFSLKRTRQRWLPEVELNIRRANRDKSMRITWDDGTSVSVYFWPKSDAKSQVQIQHGKLASKEEVERRKAFWGERLAALAELLTS